MTAMPEPLILSHPRPRARNCTPSRWVAPNASVIGQVTLAARASVWYGATLRAEAEPIEIGFGTNIQDGVTIHVDPEFPAAIGAGVSVGHNAVLHGCTIEDDASSAWARSSSTARASGQGSLIAAGRAGAAGHRRAAAVAGRRACRAGSGASSATPRSPTTGTTRRSTSGSSSCTATPMTIGRLADRVHAYGEHRANPGHRRHRLCRLPARHRPARPGPRRRRRHAANLERLADFGWHDRVTPSRSTRTTRTRRRQAFADAGPIDVVYYLVHGIGQPDFRDADNRAAANVADAAKDAGVRADRLPRRVRARRRRTVRAPDQPRRGRRTR